MSRNGSGTYTLPAGNPVVTNTTISSTWANNTLADLASAMTGSVASDGQTPMTGALNMNSNRITNLSDAIASTDAVNLSQLAGEIAALGTMALQNADNVAITGGTINGTTVGATTRSAGKFTTLDANSTLNVTGVATFAADSLFTSTGAVKIPVGTTAQQPTPATGMIRYNSSNAQFEGYYASAWSGLGSGAAGSNTQVQYNNGGALAGSSALTFNGTALATTALTTNTINATSGLFSTNNAYKSFSKAWVNFDSSSGTSCSIRSSFNVSSVTYNATGDYTVNFTTAMVDANYVTNLSVQRGDGAGNNPAFANIYATSGNAYTSVTTSSVRITTSNASAGAMNAPYVGVAVFGN